MEEHQLQLSVSTSPHLRTQATVSHAMRDVIIALMPVTLVSVVLFKYYALFLIAACLVTAVLTELLFRKILNKPVTLYDGSALVTGLLVAMLFGPGNAWWTVVLATFIGVGLAKELMGGLGWNRFNPALFGRLTVIMIYPLFYYVTAAFGPLRPYFGPIDTVTQGTPLAQLIQGTDLPRLSELFLAYPGGALGETSSLALLVGGIYLVLRKHISWHTPVTIIATVAIMALLLGQNPLYHVLAGGVIIGSFFMATDWVTSPITAQGKIVFGMAIGVLLMLFRVVLAPTEGMAFSILIMNGFVPLIDRLTKRRKFGETKEMRPSLVTKPKPAVQKADK
ncbi:MAG: RnfABCDGE type electron transport complex subunit D [Bacillota bacterium]